MTRNRLIHNAEDVTKRIVTAALTDCLKVYSRSNNNPLSVHCLYE